MQKIKTNFDQIPVAIVKKIANIKESKKKAEITGDPLIVEIPLRTIGTYRSGIAAHCRNGL